MDSILNLLAGGRELNADTFLDLGTKASWVIVGIAAFCLLLALIALIRSIVERWPERPGVFASILLVIFALGFGAGIYFVQKLAFDDFEGSINAIFTQTHQSDSSVGTSEAEWRALAHEIGAQGMTLLRNENATLPLQSGTKINLLGYRAYDPVFSGSGSGAVSADDSIGFVSALTQAGFTVNPAIEQVYAETIANKPQSSGMGFMSATFTIDEPGLEVYTGQASFENMAAYSDTAIVVIGRSGGEGSDLTKFGAYADGADNIVTDSSEKHYLELSDEERALIQAARSAFAKVIVLYNGANAMELGYIEDYNIDAALWVGIPGPYGLSQLGSILNGSVNPSGHLPDTFAYDVYSNPTRENFGQQTATNAEGEYYLDYVEGIYVGYKWYETAFAEGATITNTHTGDTYNYATDYDKIVQYPFGYGLSYTTFDQAIVGTSTNTIDPMGQITVRVSVTNTGSVAGRDAVQLYLTSPYTDYDKQNGVEKAAVQLLDFGKTKVLQPGETEELDLTVNFEEFAAYDSSHANADGTKGAYMLDAGEYILTIRKNAHEEIARTSVTLAEQFFYEGENKRPSDEVVATNQLDWAARGTYLSRNNAFANYATAMAVSPTVETSDFTNNPGYYDTAAFDSPITKNYVEGTDYANTSSTLTISDMMMAEWDDPRWEELISKLTIDEMKSMIQDTMYSTPAVASIDKAQTTDSDGPLGISSMFSTETHVAYPCLPLLSATMNKELAYTFGTYMADDAHSSGITGWYAPAMNTHRSPFSGRNFEYYSEDGVLAAKMAAAETYGARDKGYIVYIKHFFLNDQETRRSGQMHTYTNEQAAREIYLRPFEACVKDGGATAVMNSMNYVGDKWIGVCYSVQEGILRGEWGFRGRILTDMAEGSYMTTSSMAAIRCGTDMWLGASMGGGITLSQDPATNADIYYLQKVAKNILYAEVNAEISEANILEWQPIVRFVQYALAGLAGACVIRLIGRAIRRARYHKQEDEQIYNYAGGHFANNGVNSIPYGNSRY